MATLLTNLQCHEAASDNFFLSHISTDDEMWMDKYSPEVALRAGRLLLLPGLGKSHCMQ
jgi:hypothetical protein